MATPEDVTALEEAVEEIRERLQAVTDRQTWDEEVNGPALLGRATVSLTIGIDNARHPVEAAEAMLDILIRAGADTFVLAVEDQGADGETTFVRSGAVLPAAEVFAASEADDDDDDNSDSQP